MNKIIYITTIILSFILYNNYCHGQISLDLIGGISVSNITTIGSTERVSGNAFFNRFGPVLGISASAKIRQNINLQLQVKYLSKGSSNTFSDNVVVYRDIDYSVINNNIGLQFIVNSKLNITPSIYFNLATSRSFNMTPDFIGGVVKVTGNDTDFKTVETGVSLACAYKLNKIEPFIEFQYSINNPLMSANTYSSILGLSYTLR